MLQRMGASIVALALTLACSELTPPIHGTLTVFRSSDALYVGDTAQLSSTVSITGGSAGAQLDWTSTNPSTLAVSSHGVATGLSAGSASVVVQIHGSKDSTARGKIDFTVANGAFTVHPDSLRAFVGTYTLLTSGPPSGADVTQVHTTGTVSDPSVVTVAGAHRIGAFGYNDSTSTYATLEKTGVATVSLRYAHHTASTKIVVQTWPLSSVTTGVLAPGMAGISPASCGLLSTGEAVCWGPNDFGQLGVATWYECQGSGCQYSKIWQGSTAPLFVSGGFTFATLATGSGFACGVTSAGSTYCWGENSAKQLGVSDAGNLCSPYGGTFPGEFTLTNCSARPLLIPGSIPLVSLSAGGQHACGLTAAGAAYCWGSNARGQLGSASAGVSTGTPTPVDGGLAFSSISAGANHTCGITTGGDTYCWGDNKSGQLGMQADTTAHVAPIKLANGITPSTIYTGNTTFALTSSGALYRWGPNLEQLAPATQFATVSVGLSDSGCALDAGGSMSCWGAPSNGITTVTASSAGMTFKTLAHTGGMCGQATDNHWYCWSSTSPTGSVTLVPGQP